MSSESGSKQSMRSQLIAVGSDELEASEERLALLVEFVPVEDFLADLALTADVDVAIEYSTLLQIADPVLAQTVLNDPYARLRWLLLCGASPYLADFCVKHPETMRYLFNADEGEFNPTASLTQSFMSIDLTAGRDSLTDAHINQLRIAYRQQLVRIALQDLTGENAFEKTALLLSDLADATLEAAFMLASRNIHLHSDAEFAVIAMGKTGGQELNYISDVDVLFVVSDVSAELQETVLSQSQQLARLIIHILMSHQTELPLWQIDANLRPEGKDGALVRTLSSYQQYYERWAETWEFQALLKARPMAGSKALAETFVEMIGEYVWSAAKRDNFVQDVQHMRKRVIANIPEAQAQRELKLGVGGLRDIEFAVQLLQMVHGANDVSIRSANTLRALDSLSQWGYVAREDAQLMREIYIFERELEHRIQMFAMTPTHLLPESEADIRRLARLLGYKSNPLESLHKQLNQYRSEARRLHEKLFYKPLLQAVARADTDVVKMSIDAAVARLAALGFIDPDAALRHIEFLTAGVSRRAIIQRNLLPVVLSWMAETPNPDGGLLGFRNLSEALGESPWYLKLLRDESLVLKRLAHILCVSPFIARMIERTPEAMGMLADDAMLAPRDIKSLREEMQHTGARQASIDESIQVIRNIRQRELIRIATADILSIIETEKVLSSLTDLTDACIQSAMLCYEHFYPNPGGRVSLIGLGRFGGQEMSYASDADVMVVFDASNSKDALTSYVFDMIPTLQQLFAKPAVDPALVLDFDLRPEGRQGPIARSLQSYREYYERWSLTWESQALLRARYVAGDSTLGHEFLELIEPLRYPVEGLSDTSVRDIRAMKARVESERLPRGVDPKLHLKLGPGGLSDIEWLVQFVQLLYAGKFPTLKTVSTLDVLKQLPDVIGLATSDVEHCKAVWLFASRLRNYLLLVDSKERDVLTLQPQTLRLLSYLLDEESTFDVIEHWLRLSRRARKVFTSVVYEAQN